MIQELAPGQRIDSYLLLEHIGSGSTGTVYRAQCSVTGSEIALKIIHSLPSKGKDERARLRREADIQSRLDHPNIARIEGFHDASPLYFVMEYVPGDSLAGRWEKEGIAPAELFGFALQIVDGLAAAWRCGETVHRDVKPSNIRITPEGRVKLVDFGLARSMTDDLATTLTGTGLILGTPSYMSPEQALGRPVDFRSDLYSLGVLLYQGVTSRLPFVGRNPVEVILKHREEAPLPPERHAPGLPPLVSRTLLRMLEKDPGARFPTFDALRSALEDCRSVLDGMPPGSWSSPHGPFRDHRRSTVKLGRRSPGREPRRVRFQRMAVAALLILSTGIGIPSLSYPEFDREITVAPRPSPHAGDGPTGWAAPRDAQGIAIQEKGQESRVRAPGRPPCGFELRGIPCPFEQPWSPEVGEARARAVRSRPWRVFPLVLQDSMKILQAFNLGGRAGAELTELDRELHSRINALAYVTQATKLDPQTMQLEQEMVQFCHDFSRELRQDSAKALARLGELKARVDKLSVSDRELLDEVMMYGNVPDRLNTGPGFRNRSGFVELATIQTPNEPGMFEVSIKPAR